MTKQTRKQEKAVGKIKKAIRKAVDKGVSARVVATTVESAMAAVENHADSTSPDATSKTPKAVKMPGRNKQTDVTLKRGVVTSVARRANKATPVEESPELPDSERTPLKKLPGKRKPPTLTRNKPS